MEIRNEEKQPRFQIEKLEERIAPGVFAVAHATTPEAANAACGSGAAGIAIASGYSDGAVSCG